MGEIIRSQDAGKYDGDYPMQDVSGLFFSDRRITWGFIWNPFLFLFDFFKMKTSGNHVIDRQACLSGQEM